MIAPHELVSGLRSPGARLVGEDGFAWLVFPFIQDTLDKGPCSFYLVAPGKERRVTQHAVEYETFICLGLFAEEGGAIKEIHVNGTNLHLGTRYLGTELE